MNNFRAAIPHVDGGLATHSARSRSGLIDSPASGKLVATNVQCN